MKTRDEIEAELYALVMADAGPTDAQLAHRQGRVRSLVWALTGEDPGYNCLGVTVGFGGDHPQLFQRTLDLLGWRWEPDVGAKITIRSPLEEGGRRDRCAEGRVT